MNGEAESARWRMRGRQQVPPAVSAACAGGGGATAAGAVCGRRPLPDCWWEAAA